MHVLNEPFAIKVMNDVFYPTEREYHNFTHVSQMCAEWVRVGSFSDNEALFFPILFHDYVYNIGSSTNEEESAFQAVIYLSKYEKFHYLIPEVKRLIMLKKTHTTYEDTIGSFFIDLDLSILGSDTNTYKNYARNIRKEFKKYSDEEYKNGRQKVLISFLKRRIFHSFEFLNLENKAILNIVNELRELEK